MRKISVLHVINEDLTGGAEKLILDLAIESLDEVDSVGIMYLKGLSREKNVSLNNNRLNVHYPAQRASYLSPLWWREIIKIQRGYSAIYVHLFPALYISAICKPFLRRKSFMSFIEHSTNNRRRSMWIGRLLDGIVYARYDRIIAISTAVRANLCKHLSWSLTKVEIIPNGIRQDMFTRNDKGDLRSYLNIGNDDYVILHVASFQPPKDQLTLIKSLETLPTYVHVVFAGIGPKLMECKEFARRLPYSSRIHFLGKRDDVPQLLKASDCFVLSSGYEGMPMSLLEAMTSKLPCIGADVPGISELLSDCGLTFRYSDAESLANRIQLLLESKELAYEIAEKSFQKAKNYTAHGAMLSYLQLAKRHFEALS